MNSLPTPLLTAADAATVIAAGVALYFLFIARTRGYAGFDGVAGYAFGAGLAIAGLFAIVGLLGIDLGLWPSGQTAAASRAFEMQGRAVVWLVVIALFGTGLALFLARIRQHRHQTEVGSAISQSVLEHLDEAYVRTDRDGVVRYASESAARVFGCPLDTLIGARADSFYRSPEDRENLLRMVDEAGGALTLTGTRFRRRDGSIVRILYNARRITDGSDCDGGLEAFIKDITSEYEADAARAASEERFRDFAEMSSDWLWETDAGHRVEWVSESFDERSGRKRDDILGLLIWESFGGLYPRETGPGELRTLIEAHRPVENLRYHVTRPNGERLWRRLNARPRFDEKGTFLGYRGATSDITASVTAEGRFRNLIEASPDMIFVHRRGEIVYVNPALVEAFGGTGPEDFLGEDTLIFSHPDEREIIRQRRQDQMEGKPVPNQLPVHMLRRDGSDFYGESTIVSITWEGAPATMVNLRDVTDRILAERRLRESEERFRDFAELSSDWLFEMDADDRLTWVSDSFHEKSPVPAEEIVGTLVWELAPYGTFGGDESSTETKALIEARKPIRDYVYSLTSSRGEVFWRRMNAQPRFDSDGKFLGYRGSNTDITAQVSTERNFRGLIENLPDAICIQRDNVIRYVNPALVRIFRGESAETYLGTDSLYLSHPDEYDRVRERRAALLRGETIHAVTHQRLVRRDGSEFAGEVSAAQIVWEGQPATMVILRDISERVAAEMARQESERQYRLLAEMLPEAFVIQCEGVIVYANASARALFGSGIDDDLTGRDTLMTVAPEFRDGMLQRRGRVIATGKTDGPARCKHVRADGTTFESETVIGPLDWHGRPATINIIADISDRIAAERAREESEQRFRDFAESTSDWFWEMDSDLRITWLSTPMHPVNGHPADQVVGRYAWELSHVDPAESPAWHSLRRDYLEQRRPFRDLVLEAYRSDGSRYYVSLSGTPRFDEDGEFLGYRGSTADATNQIDLESRLRQSMKMEAIGQLTGGVAHDFNNLLAIISGNLELLAERTDTTDPDYQFLAPALRSAERGADLTRYLLAFSRQQPLEPRPVDINRLIAGMTEPLRRALGERIELETVIAAGGWLAHVDPGQTETAILNLALNARDAMPGGGRLTIETANATLDEDYTDQVEDVRPGRYLMISVSDEGGGIAPELIDRVFDPFVTTKDVGQGSGLGLSMVYGFVKQSGGHVRIYSEVGKGTTVRMYLPKATAGEAELPVPSAREAAQQGNGEAVLVVEDDPDVLNLVDVLLTNLNYKVLKAADPAGALKLLAAADRVDLLLTDVVLPSGISGVELSQRVAETNPDIPVIYMSGYTENSIIHQGVLDEGVMLLSKPFKKRELADLVRRALNDRGNEKNA